MKRGRFSCVEKEKKSYSTRGAVSRLRNETAWLDERLRIVFKPRGLGPTILRQLVSLFSPTVFHSKGSPGACSANLSNKKFIEEGKKMVFWKEEMVGKQSGRSEMDRHIGVLFYFIYAFMSA